MLVWVVSYPFSLTCAALSREVLDDERHSHSQEELLQVPAGWEVARFEDMLLRAATGFCKGFIGLEGFDIGACDHYGFRV